MDDPERTALICLYLENYADARSHSPVPPGVTAAGIGDALEVGDAAANRIALLEDLRSLQDDGLVVAEERPVDGFDHSRTAYFLTEAGERRASEVRDRVVDQSVTVTNGTSVEVTLGEAQRYFEDSEAPLVTALARANADGKVPLDRHTTGEFVGREEELATVRKAIESSFTRESRAVVVGGAAGTGKSTLVRAAIDEVREDREDLLVAKGASPAGAADPYVGVRQAFEAIPGGEDLVARLTDAQPLGSADTPEMLRARRRSLFEDVADDLRAVVSDRPLVVFLDNLHWADEATLELFGHLATTLDAWVHPVAFVATYRKPTVTAIEDHPLPSTLERIDERGACTEVTLGPLSRAETRALLVDVLGEGDVPDAFVDLVYDRTGGNPLFVRETATHLREADQVDPEAGRFPTDPEPLGLPAEVTEQIERRLRPLDDPSRELLRLGAVMGEHVSREVLSTASDLSPADHREYVDLLVASRIWTDPEGEIETSVERGRSQERAGAKREGSQPEAERRTLEFVTGALREAVVDRLSEDESRTLHRRIADAYVDVYGRDRGARSARIAYHYERAGAPVEAVELYRRAGSYARQSYAHEDAVESYESAVEIGRGTPDVEDRVVAATLADLADVHGTAGEYDAAVEAAERGLAIVPEPSRIAARLLGEKAAVQFSRGDFEAAAETARRQRESAETAGAPGLEAEAHYHLGKAMRSRGEYDRAREHVRESLAIRRDREERRAVGDCLVELGVLSFYRGEYDDAEDHYERGLSILREAGDRNGVASALNNLGVLVHHQGQRNRAREYYEESLAANRETGNPRGEVHALVNLGNVAREVEDYDRARERYQEGLDIAREIGARQAEANCLNNLGLIAKSLGEFDRAREYYEESLDVKTALGDRKGAATTRDNLGTVARWLGNHDRAREYYRASLETSRDIGDRSGEADSLANLGVVATLTGRFDEASDYLERALAIAEELGDDASQARIHRHRGTLAAERGEFDRARERYERSLAVAESAEDESAVVAARQHLADLSIRDGDYRRAEQLLQGVRTSFGEGAPTHRVAVLELVTARLALATGDLDRAWTVGESARNTFETMGSDQWIGRTRRLQGRIAAADGDLDGAESYWGGAVDCFESVGAVHDALRTLELWYDAVEERGDDDSARELRNRAGTLLETAPGATATIHREWISVDGRD